MGNWIPNDPTLVAQILKISSAYTPPPPEGFVSPMTWGIESNVLERFGGAGIPAGKIAFERDTFVFNEPIDREKFEQRARSFTIVQKAINSRGEEAILSALGILFEQHRDDNGFVEMPYEAEIITARRT